MKDLWNPESPTSILFFASPRHEHAALLGGSQATCDLPLITPIQIKSGFVGWIALKNNKNNSFLAKGLKL